MRAQNIYLSVLLLLIIVPLSIKSIDAFSKENAVADKMINDNKDLTGEIEEMKFKIELLKREIEIRQNKRYIKSINHTSDKQQSIYTIQISSFVNFERARNEFNYLMEALTEKYRSFLRIEKVGKFYTVRLGKFESYNIADNFIKSLIPEISKAKIQKAFFIYGRLRKCLCY